MCPPISLDISGNFFQPHLSLSSVKMPNILNLMKYFCLGAPRNFQLIIYETIHNFVLMFSFFFLSEFSLSVKHTILINPRPLFHWPLPLPNLIHCQIMATLYLCSLLVILVYSLGYILLTTAIF